MRIDSIQALLDKNNYSGEKIKLVTPGGLIEVTGVEKSNAGEELGFEFKTEDDGWGFLTPESISGIIFPPSPKANPYGKFQ